MNEQEVWVRMMAAALAHGGPVETAAAWTDLAVAEWRKRYGAKAEPAPAPFKVGDRVRHRNHNSEPGVVTHVGRMVTVQWDRWLDTSPESPKDLILDEQEPPCAR